MTNPTPPTPSESQIEPSAESQPQSHPHPDSAAPVSQPVNAMPLHYYVLWLVAVVSLALNVFIIYTLVQVRQQAGLAFSQAADSMGTIQAGSIKYVVNINEEVPVVLAVPVKFTVMVPIKKTVPINTVVNVPIEFPFIGTRTITVPINTTIPIDLSVEVPIDHTVPINATIPVKFAVPIDLKISETAFGEGLGEFQWVLQQQAESLGAGAKP